MSSIDLRASSPIAVVALTGRLRRFVRRRVTCREDAEDVIQEAYLRLLRYAAGHEVESEERLLLTAAKNLALDSLRRRRARDRTVTEYAVIAAGHQNWPAPDEEIYSQQCLRSVERALAMLPARCREVFLLHRIDNLTYSQIALRCGISTSAVEKNIARACLLIDKNARQPEPSGPAARVQWQRRTAVPGEGKRRNSAAQQSASGPGTGKRENSEAHRRERMLQR